jgi:tetratricopeptide (TPR) repeat protein
LAEAIETYTAIIHDYPMDVEAYLVLGDLYLAGEDAAAALSLYLKARLISPENPDITSRIELAESEQPDFSKVINPLGEERRNNLLERLTGKTRGVQEQEIEKATKLLEEIIHSSNPADLVATHLDQIDSLLPALLELNIRQARMENRGDLVEGLAGIQEAIEQGGQPVASISFPKQEPMPGDEIENITLLVPNQDEPSVRAQFIQDCLMAMGKQVELAGTTDAARAVNPQMVIACNPHANPWLLEYMAECTAHKVPIILDLDADYEQMPLNHPDYIQKGLGFPTNARAYTAAFLLSNLVTTPSERFSEQLERTGYHSRPIPDGWSRTNYLWEKAAPRRSTINIGWIGGSGMLDDVAEIRRILIRVIREFSRAQLVVAEDLKAFQLFENLPENRKLFLPEVSPDDYPYILGQLDILVVPLRNVPFNFTLPDTILMQAGIKKIPWVASRNPMTVGWGAGGLLATTPEEWHTNLRQLVIEEDARIHLGEAGYEKARLRELESMKKYWMEAIQLAARDPLDRGFLSRKANIEAERDSR